MGAAGFKALLGLGLAVAAGCTSVAADERTFANSEWRVTAINGQPTSAGFSLSFRDGNLGGYLGCNRFGGTYRITGQLLTVGVMQMTQMACVSALDEPAPDFEHLGIAVLSVPMRMTWRSGRELTLSNSAGSIDLERLS